MNQSLQERPEQGLNSPKPDFPEERGPRRRPFTWKRAMLIVLLIIAIVTVGSIGRYYMAARKATQADSIQETDGAYVSAREQAKNTAYDAAYGKAYDTARENFLVTNTVTIQIGKIEEMQNLEVLSVSDISYQVDGDNWYKVPGTGVFTVDLKAAEFITDDVRQMVLIRLPNPRVEQSSVNVGEIVQLNSEEDKGILDTIGTIGERIITGGAEGTDNGREIIQNAQIKIQQSIIENQDYYQAAKSSAVTQLTTLVRQLNPALPDLEVIVEFID